MKLEERWEDKLAAIFNSLTSDQHCFSVRGLCFYSEGQ